MVFDCPALLKFRDKRPHLLASEQAGAMVILLWQDDTTGIVPFTDECLGSTNLISHEVAGKDVKSLSLLFSKQRCTCQTAS